MKTRNGFVSNSSSSSFIIRGIKVKDEEAIKVLGLNPDEIEEDCVWDVASCKLSDLESKLEAQTTTYYFGGDPTGETIIGKCYDPDDGVILEIQDDAKADEEIRGALKKLGFKNAEKLSTFFQYVSNDNY